MGDKTSWTPFSEDNLLGIVDKELINAYEALGISSAELFVINSESDIEISVQFILEIHKIAFGQLYSWAGKWRETIVSVGQLIPPEPHRIANLMYQFIDNLNYKISIAGKREDYLECLVYAHYEFIKIHPFNNGNGRTGRILMNIVALKFGYNFLTLYQIEGESWMKYINAMKAGDKGDYDPLRILISSELISVGDLPS